MQTHLKISKLICLGSLFCTLPALAAHPLITEDTGTQGTGKFQLEANMEHGYQDDDGSQTHAWIKAATLSYGIRDDVDLMFTVQHSETTVLTDGDSSTDKGWNDHALDVKWRFYEQDGISYGIKPGITLANGDENKGLGAGKITYGAMLFSSIERDPWLFNWHVGYRNNQNTLNERVDLWHLSASVWYTLADNLKLAADIGTDTNPDPSSSDRPRYLVLGAIYSPQENIDIDIGIRKDVTGSVVSHTGLAGITLRW